MSIDNQRLKTTLLQLLAIPSPCGLTDEIVRHVCRCLDEIGVEYDLTRRGTIRAMLPGREDAPARALVTHIDTIGAMVRGIGDNGRLQIAPIGHWSSRFAEGSRVTLFADSGMYRGALLPVVEWGVSRDHGVEELEASWDTVELRLEEAVFNAEDVRALGIEVGDFIALDSQPEVFDNGYVVGRNLDNKAGTAAVIELLRDLKNTNLPQNTYVIFTVTETIGAGIGGAVLPEVSELVTVDFASIESTLKSPFKRVTIASGDASGPYDFHLTAHLRAIAERSEVPYQQRYLKAFHSDAAAALIAGHDVRTAVLAYAGDASHSIERTHIDSLLNLVRLLENYLTSEPTFVGDSPLTTVEAFPHQIDSAQLPQTETAPAMADVIGASAFEQKPVHAADDGSDD